MSGSSCARPTASSGSGCGRSSPRCAVGGRASPADFCLNFEAERAGFAQGPLDSLGKWKFLTTGLPPGPVPASFPPPLTWAGPPMFSVTFPCARQKAESPRRSRPSPPGGSASRTGSQPVPQQLAQGAERQRGMRASLSAPGLGGSLPGRRRSREGGAWPLAQRLRLGLRSQPA